MATKKHCDRCNAEIPEKAVELELVGNDDVVGDFMLTIRIVHPITSRSIELCQDCFDVLMKHPTLKTWAVVKASIEAARR